MNKTLKNKIKYGVVMESHDSFSLFPTPWFAHWFLNGHIMTSLFWLYSSKKSFDEFC